MHRIRACVCALIAALLSGCPAPPPPKPPATTFSNAPRIQTIDLDDAIRSVATDNSIVIAAAKNEWTSFVIQVSQLPRETSCLLRIQSLRIKGSNASIDVEDF